MPVGLPKKSVSEMTREELSTAFMAEFGKVGTLSLRSESVEDQKIRNRAWLKYESPIPTTSIKNPIQPDPVALPGKYDLFSHSYGDLWAGWDGLNHPKSTQNPSTLSSGEEINFLAIPSGPYELLLYLETHTPEQYESVPWCEEFSRPDLTEIFPG